MGFFVEKINRTKTNAAYPAPRQPVRLQTSRCRRPSSSVRISFDNESGKSISCTVMTIAKPSTADVPLSIKLIHGEKHVISPDGVLYFLCHSLYVVSYIMTIWNHIPAVSSACVPIPILCLSFFPVSLCFCVCPLSICIIHKYDSYVLRRPALMEYSLW